MILPDVQLPSFANVICATSGIDSPDRCNDPKHFRDYPWPVEYRYNSRGFRDHEWPDDVTQAVWCLGDSFTAGIGQPFEHTWPQQLAKVSGRRVVNVSMDGASNQWILRRLKSIIAAVDPKNIIVMWSFLHRREIPGANDDHYKSFTYDELQQQWREYYQATRDPSWPSCDSLEDFVRLPARIADEIRHNHQLDWLSITDDGRAVINDDTQKRLHHVRSLDQDDIENFQQCLAEVSNRDIIHATIPKFAPARSIQQCRAMLEQQPKTVPYFENLDWARDKLHFDIKTSQWLAHQILPMLV